MKKRQKELEKREGFGAVKSGLESRILLYLFKFRFLDIKVITTFETANITSVRRGLEHLIAHSLVSKKFDPSFRLLHLPAIYSLSPGGVTYLKHTYPDLPLRSLLLLYKNHLILDPGVQSALFVASVYRDMSEQIGQTFEIFSRYELLASRTASEVPDLRAFSSDTAHSIHLDFYGISVKFPRTALIKVIREAPDRRSDPTYPVQMICEDELTLRRVYVLIRKYSYTTDFTIQKIGSKLAIESES